MISQNEVVLTHLRRQRTLTFDEWYNLASSAAMRADKINFSKISRVRKGRYSNNALGVHFGEFDFEDGNPDDADDNEGDDLIAGVHEMSLEPDLEVHQAERRPRRPPVPDDLKLPPYIYKKLNDNRDTQKWYQLSEGSRREIVRAISQLAIPRTLTDQ